MIELIKQKLDLSDKTKTKIDKAFDWVNLGFDCFSITFLYAAFGAILCFVFSIILHVWNHNPDSHTALMVLGGFCVAFGCLDAWKKNKKKLFAKPVDALVAGKSSEKPYLFRTDALILAGAVDYLLAVKPDYYNRIELEEARRHLQAGLKLFKKQKNGEMNATSEKNANSGD